MLEDKKTTYEIFVHGEFEPFYIYAKNLEYAIILLQAKAIETYGKTYSIKIIKQI